MQNELKRKCPYCEREFSKYGLKTHIYRAHTEEGKNFNPCKGKDPWNKGLTKETNASLQQASQTLKDKINSGEVKNFKGRKHTSETKEKIRKARFKYLKQKTGNTAWEKVHRGELTYLEKNFYNEITKYKLFEKYDIVYNYAEYPYFLDFAFLNINFVVELDGACHFNNGVERIQHDIDKDNYLHEKGWKVFRIAYNDNWEDKINELFNILQKIEDYHPKSLQNRLYIRSEYKQDIKQKVKKKEDSIYNNKQQVNIDKILKSNIDFSKYGWVQEVSILIDKKPQKITQWMQKYMFDFWNEKCFKRKNIKKSN